MRWVRVAASSPAIALLAWAVLTALSTARVDGVVAQAAAKLANPRVTGHDWSVLRAQLDGLGSAGLSNPTTHELLGVVAVRRDPTPGNLREAVAHFSRSLALRPVSGYTWVNLAGANYQLGDTGSLFERSLVTAAELAPNEPAVQALVVDFGLAVLDEVRAETRAAIERMLVAGLRRNPLETLQIASRRARLDTACRHLAAIARRTDPKWSGICQSTGARQ